MVVNYLNDSIRNPSYDASRRMETKVTGDVIKETIGDWGKWQLRAVALIFLCKIPAAWFMACIIYTAPFAQPGEYYCRPPNNSAAVNESEWIQSMHPVIQKIESNDELIIDYCNVFAKNDTESMSYGNATAQDVTFTKLLWRNGYDSGVSVVACDNFIHNSIYDSLVTQFDLVCSRTIWIAITQFYHLFGVLTGGIFATKLLEFFSPRKIMLFGMITQIFCGCVTGLVNDFSLHIFFRYLSAVCCAQMYTAGQMIFSDITGGSYRKSIICLFEIFWGIGVILLPALAHFFPSWSSLYLAISLPTVAYIVLWIWIPDSPRWFLKRGRVDEVKNILLEASTVNGRNAFILPSLECRISEQSAAAMKEPAPLGWWSLWDNRKNVIIMIALHTAWAIYVTNYMGMLLNIRAFGREYLDINTVIAGVCEILGTLCGWFLIMKTRFKWLWTGIFNIVTGFITVFGFALPESLPEPWTVALLMTLAMLSKMATTCSQVILVTCTAELLTTLKQKIGIFSCVVWARIWLLTAPFIGALTFIHNLFPLVAFGMLGLIGGICTCIISRQLNNSRIDVTDSNGNSLTYQQTSSNIFVIERTKL